jgi:hypothetical protein
MPYVDHAMRQKDFAHQRPWCGRNGSYRELASDIEAFIATNAILDE